MGVKQENNHVKFGRTIRLGKNIDLDNAVAGEVEIGSLRDTGSFIERWNGTSWEKVAPGAWVRDPETLTTGRLLTLDDDVILADSTSGNMTLALPPAADAKGKLFYIKKIVAANTVTLDPDGSELIDLASTEDITALLADRLIVSDGTEWWIL